MMEEKLQCGLLVEKREKKQTRGGEGERNNRRKASGASASPPLSLSIPHIERETHTHITHTACLSFVSARLRSPH